MGEKSHENILILDISYKTLIDLKPLRIRFFKIDEIIRIYDGSRYLTLLGSEKYEARTTELDLISQKSDVTYIFSHYFFENQNRFLWIFSYRKNIDFE